MALGGGSFATQNKTLPGSYINFVSARNAAATAGNRGTAAIALELDWGEAGKIIALTADDFIRNSLKILGAAYDDEKLMGLRDIFKNASTVLLYRLNGDGGKASNAFGTANCSGTAGNSLKTVIEKNVNNDALFDVKTYFGTALVDTQTVAAATALVDNDFVAFKTDADLEVNAGAAFTGGTNGAADAAAHQAFLDKLESYACNAVGAVSDTQAINALYAAYAKRMRDELGIKLQAVVYNYAADSEAVVNVKNCKKAVYWALGVVAGTAVNRSATNKLYDGEFEIPVDYTQTQLADAIKAGEFTLHRVGADIRVLDDVNSLVTVSDEKGDTFKDNKTVRIADRIATDIAAIFNERYLGVLGALRDVGAIEDFDSSEITVAAGADKHSVVVNEAVTIVGMMAKLYMTCVLL